MENKHPESVFGDGGHYSIIHATDAMRRLRSLFPDGEANEMNFCLFSTSGVHGSYQTIEEEESDPGCGITFLIVHPRLVKMQYGNVEPKTPDDYEFLKRLRQSSKRVVMRDIG